MSDLSKPVAGGPGQARFPTLDQVWLAAALAVVLIRALAWPIIPSDFWWQLAYGRWIVENGSIPTVDYFSYTRAGEPYFDQPWLAQVIMYWIYRIGGAALSIVALAALLGVTYAMLLRLCERVSGSVRLSAAAVILSLPVAMTNWSMRSQAFALPLFVAYLAVLADWRSDTRNRLWLLPLLMIAWVNLHGSFVLGGVLISLVFADQLVGLVVRHRRGDANEARDVGRTAVASLRPLLIWGAFTAAAVFVNPRGPGVFRYVFGLVGNPAVQGYVEEWQAPVAGTVIGNLFFVYAGLVLAAVLFTRRRPDPVDMATLAAFFWLALSGQRHVIWFALVSPPFLAKQAASLARAGSPAATRQGRRGLNLAFLGAMALAVLLVLPPIKQQLPLPPDLKPLVSTDTPVASVEFMRRDPMRPERLFHTETTGSFLMWAAPEQKVFVDARVQLYPEQQLRDYLTLQAGEEVDRLLRLYAVDGLLLDNVRQERLLEWGRRSPDWEVRFEEECCTYLGRSATNASSHALHRN